MRLYSYWRSSSAWRVRIALAHKHLPCEIVPVHLLRDGGEQRLPGFLARNPLGQVPVLQENSPTDAALDRTESAWSLTQSMAILEYLEETHPAPPLLPREPRARARARQCAEIVNSGIQPLQNLRVQQALRASGMDPAQFVQSVVLTGLEALEALADATAGTFLVGEHPTFADVFLVPQLYASRRFGIPLAAFPTLLRIEAACEALPAFQAAHPSAQIDFEANPPTA